MPRGYVEIDAEKLESFLQACTFGRRVVGDEIVYVRHNDHCHAVVVKVYTSLSAKKGRARGPGRDAIRVATAYEGPEFPGKGKSFGIYKGKRIYRAGTQEAILDRLYEEMREAYRHANQWIRTNFYRLPR